MITSTRSQSARREVPAHLGEQREVGPREVGRPSAPSARAPARRPAAPFACSAVSRTSPDRSSTTIGASSRKQAAGEAVHHSPWCADEARFFFAGVENFDGSVGTSGFSISRDPADQALPLLRLQHPGELGAGLGRAAARIDRRVADVHVIVVVAHRERRPAEVHQRDQLVGHHRALEVEDLVEHRLGDRPGALVAEHRQPVQRRDVDGAAGRVVGDVAGGRERRSARTCSEVTPRRKPRAERYSSSARMRRSICAVEMSWRPQG